MNEEFDTLSTPLQVLTLVWNGTENGKRDSWRKLNSAMQAALTLTIEASMTFGTGDFTYIAKNFRPEYWWGDAEGYYTRCVTASNISACQSFEAYVKRPPFIADFVTASQRRFYRPAPYRGHIRGRLAVGLAFPWDGKEVTVTSFGANGEYLTAVTYKPRVITGYDPTKIDRRYTITVKDLRDAKDKKDA